MAVAYRHGMRFIYAGLRGGRMLFLCRSVGNEFELMAEAGFRYRANQAVRLEVRIGADEMEVSADGVVTISAKVPTEPGGFALVTERPVRYRGLSVEGEEAGKRYQVPFVREHPSGRSGKRYLVPFSGRLRVARRFETPEFGAQDVRVVDLRGDGARQFLFVQSRRTHPVRNLYREVTCITATDLNGEVIWQVGRPDPAYAATTAGHPVVVGDLANEGRVLLAAMDQDLQVRRAATGELLYAAAMPKALPGMYGEGAETEFERVCGDQIALLRRCDGSKAILTKDRYNHVWAFDEALRPLWHYFGNTGHNLYPLDLDGDGADEVFFGGRLLDGDGRVIWDLDLADHMDQMVCGPFVPAAGDPFTMALACGEEGLFIVDRHGTVLARRPLGHTQAVGAGRLVPGREDTQIVAVSAWGYPGVTWVLTPEGEVLAEFRGRSTLVYAPAADGRALLVTGAGLLDWQGNLVAEFEDGRENRHYLGVAETASDGARAVLGIRADRVSVYEPDDALRNVMCLE